MKKLFLFSLAACLMASTAQAQTFTGTLVTDEIALIEFDTSDIFNADGDWLDINTDGTTVDVGGVDTELFLFSGSGTSATYTGITDDDDGPGFLSALSFGAGGGITGPNGADNSNAGEDGDLAAGTYTLVISGWNQSAPDAVGQTIADWQLDDTNTEAGTTSYVVNIASFRSVPEPTSAAVFLCAALGVVTRRRR